MKEDISKWTFLKTLLLKPRVKHRKYIFSGKQYALHCSILEPEENKFVYHLSDDTTHDSCFVHQALEDTFARWGIGNETVVIRAIMPLYNTKTNGPFKHITLLLINIMCI